MKKSFLFPLLLLLATSLFAQRTTLATAGKNTPIFVEVDPHQDVTPPEVSCLNGLSVNVMPTGMIQLLATDFLLSVSDNVTPTDQIKIAVRKAGTGFGFPVDAQGNPRLSVVFDCDHLGTQAVELWAKDLKGNTAHCLAYTIVQDNFGICFGNPPGDWLIEICAKTEGPDGIEDVEFVVSGSNPNGPFYAFEVSEPTNGCGQFDVPLGSNVTATPIKDDSPLNGVTVYDLVLISKHILGIEMLNSPYKMIAADADRNGVIDSTDIVELRKLITGIYTELPNNTSWRFVDKSYVFPDPSNPFAAVFPESLTVQNIQFPVSADFIGIKVGDVNNTAVANVANHEPEDRAVIPESSSIGLPRPNPTEGDARIPIYLPSAENVRLEISDLAGKLLWVNDLRLEKGNHNLEIPASVMSGKGVYVWRVWAGEVIKAGKVVRL
ncbi:MAG: T9SS type A sorting domain-containing protein [Phycisphaerae bacterium]|nr:T9SS type A sorting domain-containing protein [Saprospiraceae bacterium]